ncbi:MAG: metal ABC transporter ATP-binding protein [Armatimonadetes bacterium]|nr:metal ABC transporter ATP-binding protein [Armatimonadota bacterium]
MSDIAVRLNDVHFAYNGSPVLRGMSLELPHRGFVGLVGPNGCGKSTAMRLLLGLLEPTAGSVNILDGPPLSAVRRGDVGYVPQKDTFHRTFPLTVFDVVMMGRAARIGLGRHACRHDRVRAMESLDRFGLTSLRNRSFGALSGGQQRLVLLARALAQEPKVLFMDEADTGLDELRREGIYRELNRLRRDLDLSILAISHQLDLLAQVVDSAVTLRNGQSVPWCAECMHHAVGEQRPAHLGPVS